MIEVDPMKVVQFIIGFTFLRGPSVVPLTSRAAGLKHRYPTELSR